MALLDTNVHDRAAFSCGEASLDAYLKRQAGQDLKRRLAITYVLLPHDDDDPAVAFYRRYGFLPFADDPRRLYLPMASIRALFG